VEDYDYITVSTLSKKIRNCLVTGRYTASERREVETLLDKKKQALRRKLQEIKRNPAAIRFMDNPPEIFELAAVDKDYRAIYDIRGPSEVVQSAVIRKDPIALFYIQNPSENVELMTVKEYPHMLEKFSTDRKTRLFKKMSDDDLLSIMINLEIPRDIRHEAEEVFNRRQE
jgi:uncharacterized pyridoxamine 5'-phosphate oxidase family protein